MWISSPKRLRTAPSTKYKVDVSSFHGNPSLNITAPVPMGMRRRIPPRLESLKTNQPKRRQRRSREDYANLKRPPSRQISAFPVNLGGVFTDQPAFAPPQTTTRPIDRQIPKDIIQLELEGSPRPPSRQKCPSQALFLDADEINSPKSIRRSMTPTGIFAQFPSDDDETTDDVLSDDDDSIYGGNGFQTKRSVASKRFLDVDIPSDDDGFSLIPTTFDIPFEITGTDDMLPDDDPFTAPLHSPVRNGGSGRSIHTHNLINFKDRVKPLKVDNEWARSSQDGIISPPSEKSAAGTPELDVPSPLSRGSGDTTHFSRKNIWDIDVVHRDLKKLDRELISNIDVDDRSSDSTSEELTDSSEVSEEDDTVADPSHPLHEKEEFESTLSEDFLALFAPSSRSSHSRSSSVLVTASRLSPHIHSPNDESPTPLSAHFLHHSHNHNTHTSHGPRHRKPMTASASTSQLLNHQYVKSAFPRSNGSPPHYTVIGNAFNNDNNCNNVTDRGASRRSSRTSRYSNDGSRRTSRSSVSSLARPYEIMNKSFRSSTPVTASSTRTPTSQRPLWLL
eukprot:TRINITY_DN3045_c0_g2_i1.p1 TRINITY_DN3045_c0_g2~~TRINITY_DN3045_c0_g2_i1.p1  ORF type:complete len:562 (-),score=143.54 TRINITY_DN3045_c0_g2_i1:502-2187(-)